MYILILFLVWLVAKFDYLVLSGICLLVSLDGIVDFAVWVCCKTGLLYFVFFGFLAEDRFSGILGFWWFVLNFWLVVAGWVGYFGFWDLVDLLFCWVVIWVDIS